MSRSTSGRGNDKPGEGQLGAGSRAILWLPRSRSVAELAVVLARPWTGSWTGMPVESGGMSAMADSGRAVCAAGGSVA